MLSNFKIKRFLVFPVLMLTLFSYLLARSIAASSSRNKITIYHTNDIHGVFDSMYTPEGKLIQIGADVMKALKSSTPNSILVDAGDSTQGGMLASSSQGSKIIELMNEIGYDLMTLGNHEFDYGMDTLKLNSTLAKFKMISANTRTKEDKPALGSDTNNGCNTIMEINGYRLGFFGITTCDTNFTTHPKNIENVIFKDEIETAKEQYQYLRDQNVDVMICVSHLGNSESDVSSELLASEVPGIDIIIDGHSHEVYSKTVGHTFIQQVGSRAKNVGKIELIFDENKNFTINHEIIKPHDLINPLEPEKYQYIPDPKLSEMCRNLLQKFSEAFRIIIGKTDSGLYGGEYKKTRICRLQDTNLGNLIGDSLLDYGKGFIAKSGIAQNAKIVALKNGGGIRTSILPKFISVGDIMNVFPFPNKVSIKLATPSKLYEILENGFKSIYIKDGVLLGPDGAFPNVGGMRIEFDINGEPMELNEEKNKVSVSGSRVKKIVLLNEDGSDNCELDENDNETQIALVTDAFTSSGGDQYIALRNLPSLTDEGDLLKDVLCNYIKTLTFKNGGVFEYPATLSRVKLINCEEFFDSYDATITIKENSVELKNENVTISLDNNDEFTEKTDENGNIVIKNLDQGPHDIKVTKEHHHMNAYVNNRVGITTADIFLENTMEQDVSNVINIINGISHQKISDINEYVSFARNAYESLPEEGQILVTNYNCLVNAEKANTALNHELHNENDLSLSSTKIYTIVSILVLSFVMFIVFKTRKAQMHKI